MDKKGKRARKLTMKDRKRQPAVKIPLPFEQAMEGCLACPQKTLRVSVSRDRASGPVARSKAE